MAHAAIKIIKNGDDNNDQKVCTSVNQVNNFTEKKRDQNNIKRYINTTTSSIHVTIRAFFIESPSNNID